MTAAAGIMVVVFGAFLLSPDRMLRRLGLGRAVAGLALGLLAVAGAVILIARPDA